MSNSKLEKNLKKVINWFNTPTAHKLTCSKCNSTDLTPVIQDNRVKLLCLECGNNHTKIPKYAYLPNIHSKVKTIFKNKANSRLTDKLKDF